MGKNVSDILKALPAEGRAEFADKLKREGAVGVAFTVAGKHRIRKHRWSSATGKVVSIRFTDTEYTVLLGLAAGKGLSVGDYLKWLATRSHNKRKA